MVLVICAKSDLTALLTHYVCALNGKVIGVSSHITAKPKEHQDDSIVDAAGLDRRTFSKCWTDGCETICDIVHGIIGRNLKGKGKT